MKDYGSNRDVDRIKERLATTASPGREAGGRAGAVGRPGRRARMRRSAAGAVVVGLAAATVVVGPHFLSTSPTTNSATDPANGVTSPHGVGVSTIDPFADPCPPKPVEVADDATSTQLPFAPGATLVRLCAAVAPGGRSRWTAPHDALVVGVDDFVARVDALSPTPPISCPARLTPAPFALTIRYPHDRTVTVGSAGFSDCDAVSLGGTPISAGLLLDIYRRALGKQRHTLRPAFSPTPPHCRPPRSRQGWMASADTLDLAAATVCFIPSSLSASRDAPWQSSGLSADQTRTLESDFAGNSTERRHRGPLCLRRDRSTVILGVTAWDDMVSLDEDPCSGEYAGLGRYWVPTRATRALIESLGR